MNVLSRLLLLLGGIGASAGAQSIAPDWNGPSVVAEDTPEQIAARREAAEAFVTKTIEEFRTFTPNVFESALLKWKGVESYDQFSDGTVNVGGLNQILLSAWIMKEEKKLTREQEQVLARVLKLRDKASFASSPTIFTGDSWQSSHVLSAAYARALGMRFSKTDRYLKAWFDGTVKNPHKHFDNSTVYFSTALKQLVEIAVLIGQESKLKNDNMRMWFDLMRDMVGPNGMPPTYGKNSSGERVYHWAFVLEAAAILFDDPSYLYAADKVSVFHSTLHGHYQDKNMVYPHVLLDRTELAKMTPVPPEERSLVMRLPNKYPRREAALDKDNPYKLVLRTGHAIESGYVLMDLGFGPHTMTTQRQSIPYYCAMGVGLYQYFEANRELPGQGASLVLQRKGMDFPMTPAQFNARGYTEFSWEGPDPKKFPDLSKAWKLYREEGGRPVVVKAEVEDRDTDSFARVVFKHVGDERTSAVRQLLLTTEGLLVVRDDVDPSRSFKEGTLGVTWPIYSKYGPKSQGANWWVQGTQGISGLHLDKRRHDAHVLVYHVIGPGQKASIADYVTSLRVENAPTMPLTFVTVLVPISPRQNAAELAAKIQASVKHGGLAALRIPKGAGNLTIQLDAKGSWKVHRDKGILVVAGEPTRQPDDAFVEKMGTELLALVQAQADQMKGAKLQLKGSPVQFLGVEGDVLLVQAGTRKGRVPWGQVSEADRARLAYTMSRALPDNVQANTVGAFYLFKVGQAGLARALLGKAGPRQEELRTAFGIR